LRASGGSGRHDATMRRQWRMMEAGRALRSPRYEKPRHLTDAGAFHAGMKRLAFVRFLNRIAELETQLLIQFEHS
jgi:hypothetical protein